MALSTAQIKQQAINEAAKKFRDNIEGYNNRAKKDTESLVPSYELARKHLTFKRKPLFL
jgi:hypothetical protein